MRRLFDSKLIIFIGVASLALLIACSSPPKISAQPTESPSPLLETSGTADLTLPEEVSPTREPIEDDESLVNSYEGDELLDFSEAFPTPLPIPHLALEGGTGDLVCAVSPDSSGNSALSAHWTIDVEPGAIGSIDYPFAQGDTLELSVFGQKIQGAYMEDPAGQRIVDIEDTLRPWTGDVLTASDGRYRFYFDNTNGDSVKIMHLVITYHIAAPGSVILAPYEDDVRISLPTNENQG